jgi:hypothetical protein
MQTAIRAAVLAMLTSGELVGQAVPGTQVTASVSVASIVRIGDTSVVSYVVTISRSSKERLFALTIEAPAPALEASDPSPHESWDKALEYGGRPVVRWIALNDSILQPGARSQVLSFRGIGLPAIVDAHLEGDYEPPDVGDDDSAVGDPLVTNSVAIRVVGVEAIPAGVTLATLTLRLDSLTTQACSLGWITQARLCSTLRGRLSGNPPQLASFQSGLASGHVSGGPVSDNAYWLLKTNADYIRHRHPTKRVR